MKNIRPWLQKISFYVGSLLVVMILGLVGKNLYDRHPVLQRVLTEIIEFFSLTIYAPANLTVGSIFLFIILLGVGIWFSKYLSYEVIGNKVLKKTKLNKGARASVESLTHYTLLLLFIALALYVAKVPLTLFTLLGGALALGFGFASRNIISDLMGGIVLQLEQPLKVGDTVEVEDIVGVVEHIGGRRTTILTSNNTHLILPNNFLMDKKIVNWTLEDQVVRLRVGLKVVVATNPKKLEEIILQVFKENGDLMTNPAPYFYLEDLSNSCLEYGLYLYIPLGIKDRHKVVSDFRRQLLEALNQSGIKLYVSAESKS